MAGNQQLWFWLVIPLGVAFILIERRWSLPSWRQYSGRLLIALCGYSFDSLLMNFGLIQFSVEESNHLFAPIWLMLLWLLFAFSFSACYCWLANRPIVAMYFASLFGPLAYWGSTQISSVIILDGVMFTLFSGLFLGTLFSVIFFTDSLTETLIFDTKKQES